MGVGLILIFILVLASIVLFLQSPLQKVTFDERTGMLCYYWLFSIKRAIPLADIEDWDGHTTSTAKYKDGKRMVSYTHIITVYTKDGDSYAFNVYARAKMKEFDIKLCNALDAMSAPTQ